MDNSKVLGYMCGVDYQWELGECDSTIYASVESLKEKQRCWESCGIVKLSTEPMYGILQIEWVEPQDLWKGAISAESMDEKS